MTVLSPLRGVRTRLLLIVVVALALALAAATVGFNVLLVHASSQDADSVLRARANAELALIRVKHGKLVLESAGEDSQVWVFAGRRAVESARSGPATAAAARRLAGGPLRFIDVPVTDHRLLAVPVRDGRRQIGTVVAALSLAPYEQAEKTALVGSLALALTLLALVGIAVWWLLRSALRPVARMTEEASAWSDHDLDRRFSLGPAHDELTRLGSTLDGLLDRLAASLRHERRFSAEMSHELRTPLAKLTAEAELTLRRDRTGDEYRESLTGVLQNAKQIERIVDALVAAARREAGPRGVSDASAVAHAVAGSCAEVARERGVEIAVREPSAVLRVGVDDDLAERILHPVVENACRYGRSRVVVAVEREGTGVAFAVEDDGPGVGADERESIFEPAVRGSAGRDSGVGAGLGLALARRLARAAEGEIELLAGARGRFVVHLPAA